MNVFEAVNMRRSYRGKFKDVTVPREDLVKILGVPDDYDLVCFLPVGIAEDEARMPVKKSFEERAWFNVFPKD